MSIDDEDAHAVAVATALARVARPFILQAFRPDSCIASTRIGLDVLKYFHVAPALPIALTTAVYNQDAIDLLDGGMTMPELQQAMNERTTEQRGGPWAVGIGADMPNSPGWAGHLIVGLPKIRLLVDLSIDQANRPLKNIEFEGGVTLYVPNDAWWLGEDPLQGMRAESEEGDRLGLVLDRRCPDPDGFRDSPNWHRTSTANPAETRAEFRHITGQIIRRVKEELRG